MGVDVGTDLTHIGGLEPDNSESILLEENSEESPVIPTRGIALGDESVVGHEVKDLVERGEVAFEIMGPFKRGKQYWEQEVTSLKEDPCEDIRRKFFDYLYSLVDESLEHWKGRIAVPARPSRPEAGQALLEEYLSDAGFDIYRRVDSQIATAVGYWKYDSYYDPHFSLDHMDGGVVLCVDLGAKYFDASVISISLNKFRTLATESRELNKTLIQLYADAKANQNGLEIEPCEENAPRRFALLNSIEQHLPELITNERQMVRLTIPDEFEGKHGTQITLSSSEIQDMAREQMEVCSEPIYTAIESAGLNSLADIDLVITGGMPSRTPPVLRWWIDNGGTWGMMNDPNSTIDPDATVRLTGGIGGKLLAAKGASAISHTDVGYANGDIKIV